MNGVRGGETWKRLWQLFAVSPGHAGRCNFFVPHQFGSDSNDLNEKDKKHYPFNLLAIFILLISK